MTSSALRRPTAAQHRRATAALSLSSLFFSFLLHSVFPYSGYMSIHLLPDKLNEENAGFYASLLSSAMMLGRCLGEDSWRKVADLYGRVPSLGLSLLLTSFLSLAFGLSSSYWSALTWRFLLGLANGILPIVKTTASEMALGDKALEARGMGRVMSMWGWGLLIAPAISGVCSDPLRQYPRWLPMDSPYYPLLQNFPFFLPNAIAAVLGLLSLFAVNVFVEETLPQRRVRSVSRVPSDIWTTMRKVLSIIPEALEEETTPLQHDTKHHAYQSSRSIEEEVDGRENDDSDCDTEFEEMAVNMLETDVAGAVRESKAAFDESVVLLSTTFKDMACQAIATSVTHRTTLNTNNAQHRISRLNMAANSRPAPATLGSLWAQKGTRCHLILFWVSSFVMVAVEEGFPLFCISRAAGLGLPEKSIGLILALSGFLFCAAQYAVYSALVHWFGLYGSIRLSSVIMGPMVALIPISLWLNQRTETGDSNLSFSGLLFLSILMASYGVFGLVFFSSLAVALNRTVLPTHRGTMNGLAALGRGVAKALSPTFTGTLVAFSFSSGCFSPHVGALVLWLMIGGLGAVVTLLSRVFIRNDDEDESNAELNV